MTMSSTQKTYPHHYSKSNSIVAIEEDGDESNTIYNCLQGTSVTDMRKVGDSYLIPSFSPSSLSPNFLPPSSFNAQESSISKPSILKTSSYTSLSDASSHSQNCKKKRVHHSHSNLSLTSETDKSEMRKSISLRSLELSRSGSSCVSFHSVNVREYDRTIGDNPSCVSGPPISLDWTYSEKHQVSIDEFEISRNQSRRHKQPLKLSKYHRENILKFGGYTNEEIKIVKKEKKKVRRGRAISTLISPFWRLEDLAQSLKRKLWRKLSNHNLNGLGLSSSRSTRNEDSSGRSRSKRESRKEVDGMENSRKSQGSLASSESSDPGITF